MKNARCPSPGPALIQDFRKVFSRELMVCGFVRPAKSLGAVARKSTTGRLGEFGNHGFHHVNRASHLSFG